MVTIVLGFRLFVGDLEIAVVDPAQLDISKTLPGLVFAEETIALIELVFCSPEA